MENPFKTYKPSFPAGMVGVCGFGILVGLFLILFPLFYANAWTDSKDYRALWVIGFLLVFFCGFILHGKSYFRVETGSRKIRFVGLFGPREFELDEIEGYRSNDGKGGRIIKFYPKGMGGKIILYFDSEEKNEFFHWVEQNFTDLDALDAKNEEKEAYSDERLGTNEAERKERLKAARGWNVRLMVAGIILCLWSFIWPHPYEVLYPLLILLPVLAIFMPLVFPGAVKFLLKLQTIYSTTIPIYIFPSIGLLISSSIEWKIIDAKPFWPPFWILTILMLILLLLFSGNDQKNFKTYLTAFLICAAYSGGTIHSLNCLLDKSAGVNYPSKVVYKHSHTSRGGTSYYVALSPWGPRLDDQEMDVSREVYYSHPNGAPVTVNLKEGFFKIPWYSF